MVAVIALLLLVNHVNHTLPAEWCLGNGCITGPGTGDWHKCKPGELNVCRQWSVKKPK